MLKRIGSLVSRDSWQVGEEASFIETVSAIKPTLEHLRTVQKSLVAYDKAAKAFAACGIKAQGYLEGTEEKNTDFGESLVRLGSTLGHAENTRKEFHAEHFDATVLTPVSDLVDVELKLASTSFSAWKKAKSAHKARGKELEKARKKSKDVVQLEGLCHEAFVHKQKAREDLDHALANLKIRKDAVARTLDSLAGRLKHYHDKNILFLNLHHEQMGADAAQWKRMEAEKTNSDASTSSPPTSSTNGDANGTVASGSPPATDAAADGAAAGGPPPPPAAAVAASTDAAAAAPTPAPKKKKKLKKGTKAAKSKKKTRKASTSGAGLPVPSAGLPPPSVGLPPPVPQNTTKKSEESAKEDEAAEKSEEPESKATDDGDDADDKEGEEETSTAADTEATRVKKSKELPPPQQIPPTHRRRSSAMTPPPTSAIKLPNSPSASEKRVSFHLEDNETVDAGSDDSGSDDESEVEKEPTLHRMPTPHPTDEASPVGPPPPPPPKPKALTMSTTSTPTKAPRKPPTPKPQPLAAEDEDEEEDEDEDEVEADAEGDAEAEAEASENEVDAEASAEPAPAAPTTIFESSDKFDLISSLDSASNGGETQKSDLFGDASEDSSYADLFGS